VLPWLVQTFNEPGGSELFGFRLVSTSKNYDRAIGLTRYVLPLPPPRDKEALEPQMRGDQFLIILNALVNMNMPGNAVFGWPANIFYVRNGAIRGFC
jgi:hypothetical protein